MSTDRELLVQEISQVQFTPVRLREGYEMDGVDQLLDRLISALRAAHPVDELIRTALFTPVRMREGYDMDEVDWFLDQVVSRAATLDGTAPRYVDAPPMPASTAPAAPMPSVIKEQRGLLARLFDR